MSVYLPFYMRLRINWDTLGITASLACAIHCALLPLFLSSLPLFGINIINNKTFEAGMIALAFVIGCYALVHGYKRHHHKVLPLFIFIVGFIFLVVKEFFIEYETWLLIPAVFFIVSAHLVNFQYCRQAKHCHTEDC
ncbi:MAG: MerC domain-containing protein, partial [Bacteroidota bacterium]|nr:MerC domain-containing protein [Bacteroidota bacterium]